MLYNVIMITSAPLRRLLVEKDITCEQLSQITGISTDDLYQIEKSNRLNKKNLETLCRTLRCQPCDIIEFIKGETEGHWEWISAKL